MTALWVRDDCNATEVKPEPMGFDIGRRTRVVVTGDTITAGNLTLYRLEPHGFGDVHWELSGEGIDEGLRFTTVEIR